MLMVRVIRLCCNYLLKKCVGCLFYVMQIRNVYRKEKKLRRNFPGRNWDIPRSKEEYLKKNGNEVSTIRTSPFIVWKPQNQEIGEFYFIQKCRTTDFKATKLGKGRSGCW